MILNINHWKIKCFKQRITAKELKRLLLDKEDKVMINGRILNFKKRNLGAGIYEIWFEDK